MADNIQASKCEKMQEEKSETALVTEYDVTIRMDTFAKSPKKCEAFYDKDLAINRTLITTVLAAYLKIGKLCFQPVRCLDGIGSTGIMGLMWRKHVPDNISVTINDPRQKAFERMKENVKLNEADVEVLNRDTCALLHEKAFNFISLDCHTTAACYLDAVMRNLPKGGVLAMTTTDDAALHAITPEIALRNYGGFITKTFYLKELAVRLFLAAAARAAARYNKGLQVLCSVSFKSSFTVILTVKRGATHANSSIANIRKLMHCNICEDRQFMPFSKYPVSSPEQMLECGCSNRLPGKVAVELGPIWCGCIFNQEFLATMLEECGRFPWNPKTGSLLRQLVTESRCTDNNEEFLQDLQKKSGVVITWKRLKLEEGDDLVPPFYFNLHKHSPKGPQLLPVDTVIQHLHKAGYRASRTHFDREAVRTSASLVQLTKILTQASRAAAS